MSNQYRNNDAASNANSQLVESKSAASDRKKIQQTT